MDLLNEKVPPLIGILLSLCGMFFYYMSEIIGATGQVKKFSDIKLRIWWDDHQIKFTMICMVSAVLFYLSWHYDQLTAQHCLELGIMGNMFLDKFLTRMKV